MPRGMEPKHGSLDSTLQIVGNVSRFLLQRRFTSIYLNSNDTCEMDPLWLGGRKRVKKLQQWPKQGREEDKVGLWL